MSDYPTSQLQWTCGSLADIDFTFTIILPDSVTHTFIKVVLHFNINFAPCTLLL